FRHADPQRGRFRDYLKMVLRHLITDHQKRQGSRPLPLPPDVPARREELVGQQADEQFQEVWRDELTRRAWDALADLERHSGQLLFTVLHFRTDHLDMPLAEMANQLAGQFGRPVTAEWVSK